MKSMNNTRTISLIAIAAVAGLMIAATVLAQTQAFAHHRHHSSVSQRSSASLRQSNDESSVNIGGGSSTQTATNTNNAPVTSINVCC
jgi:hypothetical protein